jgi:hypothetical protein
MTSLAAYYFPNYHADPRNERRYGQGWTEWELVRRAKPRYPGHCQPRVPLWGYQDESCPAAMEQKIQAAVAHGLTQWIFDWYWYDDGPFLNRALDSGFLQASNRNQLEFGLMWANHDWVDIFPASRHVRPPLLYPGQVTPATFMSMADHLVERYFQHPSYWKIDGQPYFSIYELNTFVRSMGGFPSASAALRAFRKKARAAGFPGVHLNAIVSGLPMLAGESTIQDPAHVLRELEFDSVTSYVWVHDVSVSGETIFLDYADCFRRVQTAWARHSADCGLPYFPNVTIGWDSTPRTLDTETHSIGSYPHTAIIRPPTREELTNALREAEASLAQAKQEHRILTINAWNEWTEGSYLEPDTINGTAYLECLRDAFGKPRPTAG